ncbi:MAG: hypothetical protein ABIP51_13705, partial [Bacteroidia bacterium]
MKKISFVLAALVCFSVNILRAQDIAIDAFDKKAIEVVNNFMTAINNNAGDEMAAAAAALPYIHKSELEADGSNLKRDRL